MYHIILNQFGGSKRAEAVFDKLKVILESEHIEYNLYVPMYKGEIEVIVGKIIEDNQGIIKLIVVGGDGTINEVLNGITDFSRVRLGVIPAGSGNDFARGLGIKKNVRSAAMKIFNSPEDPQKVIDIGKITIYDPQGTPMCVKLFGISAGAGLDALVCKAVDTSSIKKFLNKIGLGNLAYIIHTVIALFTMDTENVWLTTFNSSTGEEEVSKYDKMIFLASMNFRCEGGGVPMAPDAVADDGKLSLCLAHDVSRIKAFSLLPLLSMGKHKKLKCFKLWDSNSVELKTGRPVVIHADGECLEMSDHIKVESLPGKLSVMV